MYVLMSNDVSFDSWVWRPGSYHLFVQRTSQSLLLSTPPRCSQRWGRGSPHRGPGPELQHSAATPATDAEPEQRLQPALPAAGADTEAAHPAGGGGAVQHQRQQQRPSLPEPWGTLGSWLLWSVTLLSQKTSWVWSPGTNTISLQDNSVYSRYVLFRTLHVGQISHFQQLCWIFHHKFMHEPINRF